MSGLQHAIQLENVRKAFGATIALSDVSLSVTANSVHALLGENGAGKSTIVKLLSGLMLPDSGSISIFGERVSLARPQDAHRLGIRTAFQEMTQIEGLSVAQNMLLPYEPVGIAGIIRRRYAEALVGRHLIELGLGDIDARMEVGELSLSQRQKIEIARAVLGKPRILLLDEATSSLSGADVDWLSRVVARLKRDGCTVIFITHRIAEVRRFCDHLAVLRNGRIAGEGSTSEIGDDAVIRMIIGRSLAAIFPKREDTQQDGAPAIAARRIAVRNHLIDMSFELRRGEVLGVAGLQGMGQRELFLACFGMAPLASGWLEVDGARVTLRSSGDAVSIGIGLVPEERKTESLFLEMNGVENASMPVVDRFSRFGLVRTDAELAAVRQAFAIVKVREQATYQGLSNFSGGTQQKVAIARWLMAKSRILLMYDPTRGIDIGTKHELYLLIQRFTQGGGAVLLYSTEIVELVNLCHRVIVMYGGQSAGTLTGAEITEEVIMRRTLGSQFTDAIAGAAQ
jgi:ribose transport system ATP-binding protein